MRYWTGATPTTTLDKNHYDSISSAVRIQNLTVIRVSSEPAWMHFSCPRLYPGSILIRVGLIPAAGKQQRFRRPWLRSVDKLILMASAFAAVL